MSNTKENKEETIHKPKVTNPNPKNRVQSGGYNFQITESLKFEGNKQKEEKPSEIKLNLGANAYYPKKNINPLTQSQEYIPKTYRNQNMNNIIMQPIPNYAYQNYPNNNLRNSYYQNFNGRNNFNNNLQNQQYRSYLEDTIFIPKKKMDVSAKPYIPKDIRKKEEEEEIEIEEEEEEIEEEEEEEIKEEKKEKKQDQLLYLIVMKK